MRVFLGCFWATDPAWKRGNGTLFEESKLLYLRDYELLIYFFFPLLLFNRNRKVVDYSQFQESDDAGK